MSFYDPYAQFASTGHYDLNGSHIGAGGQVTPKPMNPMASTQGNAFTSAWTGGVDPMKTGPMWEPQAPQPQAPQFGGSFNGTTPDNGLLQTGQYGSSVPIPGYSGGGAWGQMPTGGGMSVPGASDPMGGGSLSASPYMGQQMDALSYYMGRERDKGLQGIRSSFVGSGGLGSSRQGVAESEYLKDYDQRFSGAAAGMLGNAYTADRQLNTSSRDTNRALDLQQTGLGAQILGQGMNMPWLPINNASSTYRNFTGLGTQGDGGTNWSGILGGALGAAQLGKNFGWWGN